MWYWLSIFIWGLDFLSKGMILRYLNLGEVWSVFPGLNLVLHSNVGAAFSFLGNLAHINLFLAIVAMLISAWLVYELRKPANLKVHLGIAMVLGGAIGNLTDRCLYGQVIDFLDLYCLDWHYPAFNLADSAICVGIILWFWGLHKASSD